MGISLPNSSQPERESRTKKPLVLFAAVIVCIFMLLAYQWHGSPAGGPLEIRLYTNNIRYDNKNLTPGEKPWDERGPLVAQSIEKNTAHGPSVVCLQEVLHNQLQDILRPLNEEVKEWSYFGVGRQNGETKGEYAPILFKHADWELESSRTYWLSETPDIPSVGWDAALERIVSEVVLKSKINGRSVKVLNTHFDHKGVVARRELVKLIISKLEAGDAPAFLCGDLNTQPTDEPYAILKKSEFTDSRTFMLNPDEHEPTFTGFSDAEGTGIIDYVWADAKARWHGYHVLPNFFGFRMSDHRPVVADYII